jgi:hypothetical protein
MIKFYYRALDAVSGGRVYPLAGWQGSTSRRSRCGPSGGSSTYRRILGTLKYEPHAADATGLRRALEGVERKVRRDGRQDQAQGDKVTGSNHRNLLHCVQPRLGAPVDGGPHHTPTIFWTGG